MISRFRFVEARERTPGFYRFTWSDETHVHPFLRDQSRIGTAVYLEHAEHWPGCESECLEVFADHVAEVGSRPTTVLRCFACDRLQGIRPEDMDDVARQIGTAGSGLRDCCGQERGERAVAVATPAADPWVELLADLDQALTGSGRDAAMAHARTLPAAAEIGTSVATISFSNGAEYMFFTGKLRRNANWGTADQRRDVQKRELAAAELLARISGEIDSAH